MKEQIQKIIERNPPEIAAQVIEDLYGGKEFTENDMKIAYRIGLSSADNKPLKPAGVWIKEYREYKNS